MESTFSRTPTLSNSLPFDDIKPFAAYDSHKNILADFDDEESLNKYIAESEDVNYKLLLNIMYEEVMPTSGRT